MRFEAVIRASFNRYANALRRALLRLPHGLFYGRRLMARQRIVQIPNEIILVRFVKRHERSAHYDELNFVDAVSQSAKLSDPSSRLRVRIIPSSDGSHTRGFVASVGLRRVFKVRIWPAWTVNTYT